jgi:hypothetical protein
VRRAHELLAHAPRNAHDGDFHSGTSSRSKEVRRDIATPGAMREG